MKASHPCPTCSHLLLLNPFDFPFQSCAALRNEQSLFVRWEQWGMSCAGLCPAPCVCVQCWKHLCCFWGGSVTLLQTWGGFWSFSRREGRDTAGTAALVPNPLLFPPERREGWMHQPCHCPLPSLRPQIQRHFPPWSKRWIHSGAAFPTRVHPPAPLGWHRML